MHNFERKAMNNTLVLIQKKGFILALFLFSFLMVGLSITGGKIDYSPIPIWDMWNGTLDFILRISEGDQTAWWSLHNEHRITITRALFWLDYKYFGGLSWFLVIINYLLVSLIVYVLWKILRDITKTAQPKTSEFIIILFIMAWMFQWMQYENFISAFQSQFILAQLVPLCAFYYLYKSVAKENTSLRYFIIASLLGVASIFTMANGILTLPLLAFYCYLMRQSFIRFSILGILSGMAFSWYYLDHHTPIFLSDPLGLIHYSLIYLGNPFYHLIKINKINHYCGVISGFLFITSSLLLLIKYSYHKKENALPISLLIFNLYIACTAFITASGRLHLGIDQALTSRYATPALIAWATLLIISSPYLSSAFNVKKYKIFIPFTILAILMLRSQVSALTPQDNIHFQRNIAALALALGIKDTSQISQVFPSTEIALKIAEKASIKNLSIFGTPTFKGLKNQLGTVIEKRPQLSACQGSLITTKLLDEDHRFVRVSGWLFNTQNKAQPKTIIFQNSEGKKVGFALTGQCMPEIGTKIGRNALYSGFQGYIQTEAIKAPFYIIGESLCQLEANPQLFTISKNVPHTQFNLIDDNRILPNHQWTGLDYQKSKFDGLKVYGTYISSDADLGSITLHFKKGDRIFYRSGPTGGKQVLEILDSNFSPITLPVTLDWVLLDFSTSSLSESDYIIRLSDNGAGWGEWSAIAVKKSENEEHS